MVEGPMHLWNEWAAQILVLFSFTLQIILFSFAWTRRQKYSAILTILLWLAYLMADSTAVYTLGHLSITGSPHGHTLVVLWAPFLLLHLGSQDSITAYALEDNQLWKRHLLNLVVQLVGVGYVLYINITEIETLLFIAAMMMFVVATTKYTERVWSLHYGSLNNIRISTKIWQPLPTYRAPERDEEELLLFAQVMLPICKGAMVDQPMSLFTRSDEGNDIRLRRSSYGWSWNWKDTSKLVEMELSLMYDILYTKAAAIHNWIGYLIRLVSLLTIVVAFLLFQLSGGNGYGTINFAITYILFVGAIILDLASVLKAIGSTWSCNFLWTRGWSRLALVIMYLRRRVKAGSNRRWPGSIGQYNLLNLCSRSTTELSSRMATMLGVWYGWSRWHYSRTRVISEDVKELVFQRVWQALREIQCHRANVEIQSPPYVEEEVPPNAVGFGPELYEDTSRRRMKFDQAMGFGAELQHAILTWHVLTDVFLLCSGISKDESVPSAYVNAIKALSDYLVFIIAMRPDTVLGLELRSVFEATTDALESIWRHEGECSFDPCSATREEMLASILQNSAHEVLGKSSAILSHGTLYAKLLLELADVSNPDKSGIISSYEDCDYAAMDKLKRCLMPDLEFSCQDGVFDMAKALALILDTWVRLLIFASVRCSRDAHASQINRGGELTTVVWLMEEHAAMFLGRPETSNEAAV